jgi:tetratricopeptide (TPR) repeat protein
MTMADNINIKNQFNDSTLNNPVFINYGDRKTPTILTAPTASVPATFLGREKELQDIRQLLSSGNTLALVNSEGGMGKTTLAAAYWNQYRHQYKHLAWLFCENGILAAMRSQLPQPLGLQEAMNEYADSPEKQVAFLKNNLANLDKDCLLVLDNANEAVEIKAFVADMTGLGWHVLMTSRCTQVLSDPKNEYPITSLPPDLAKQLFTKNYTETNPDFDALLDRFLKAVGYNTLCIEIFSKNLREGGPWGYTFADFLTQLEQGGLFLGENSFDIITDYTNHVRKTAEKSDEIIRALYNFTDLKAEETDLLIQFSLLPAENHTPEVLLALLPNDNPRQLKRRLDSLAQKGWLATDTTSYRVSPVVQQIVLHQHSDRRWALAEPMIQKLHVIFENEGRHSKNIATAAPFAALVFGLVENINAANNDIAILFDRLWVYFTATGNLAQAMYTATRMRDVCEKYEDKNNLAIAYEKLGSTHTALGNLDSALTFFEEETKLFEELHEAFPQNVKFKNGLAISYEKLGSTHTSLGNLNRALTFFEDETKLFEALHEAFPQNVAFKSGLAISYQYLGNMHTALGDLNAALKHYQQYNYLAIELHEAFPQNVDFKNGLAISYGKLGETHTTLGNLNAALRHFQQYNDLTKELHEAFSQNVEFKNVLAISYEKLGLTHTALGNLNRALTFFEQYNELEKELHEAFPQNVAFKLNLGWANQFLGNTHTSLGDLNLNKALEFYKEMNKLFRELHEAFPQNVTFKNGLAISYAKLGATHTALGNLDRALTFFEQYNDLAKELHEAYPQNVEFKKNLAIAYLSLGQFFRDQKRDTAQARHHIERGLALYEALVQDFPDYVGFQVNLSWARKALANLDK